ncbi:5'-Nucleotidase/apyrase family protein [Pseudohyphozyma bogoriensis]|nr:5'-Nucleotidase/apyrase family protein [Pseudohyphozyma bogoriensis]
MLLLPQLLLVTTATAAVVQLPFSAPAPARDATLKVLQQPGSSSPSDWPYRPVEWGEVNILHTTDTHGWLLGHQRQEASFSGDWGDLYSFVTRMKEEATRRGVDLLLVDSGDRVDGNGLVDGEPEGHVKGYTAMKFFKEMPYDVITTGNHELYKYPVALSTYQNLAAHYGDRYLTSNVNLTMPETGESVPSGKRYRKFKTEMGRNVTAFGPLFFFKAHDKGITIQKPSEMIKEAWFQEAIAVRPDFFLLVGHMSIKGQDDSEWTTIFNAIRSVHQDVPILIFGGHHHIRDCVQEDMRSMSLASGRYMETVGFMSVSGLNDDPELPLNFSRRYLDQNRNTYKYHAGEGFDTPKGLHLSKQMGLVASTFNLTYQFGTSPQAYYLGRYPHTSQKSLLNLMTSKVLPLLIDRPDRPYPRVTILNSGSIRFDIFKGPFTRNDQWIILPFTNNFEYIRGVPSRVAKKLLPYLNLVGEHGVLPSTLLQSPSALSASIEHIYRKHERESYEAFVSSVSQEEGEKRTVGYVTVDKCPGLGDDVLHKPVPHAWQPTFVSTELEVGVGEEEKVDVVFFDFIQPDIIAALNHLQKEKEFSAKDVGLYISTLSANTLMQEYAMKAWN